MNVISKRSASPVPRQFLWLTRGSEEYLFCLPLHQLCCVVIAEWHTLWWKNSSFTRQASATSRKFNPGVILSQLFVVCVCISEFYYRWYIYIFRRQIMYYIYTEKNMDLEISLFGINSTRPNLFRTLFGISLAMCEAESSVNSHHNKRKRGRQLPRSRYSREP